MGGNEGECEDEWACACAYACEWACECVLTGGGGLDGPYSNPYFSIFFRNHTRLIPSSFAACV